MMEDTPSHGYIDLVNLAAIVKMKVIKVENRSEISPVKRASQVR
jgi:hypothetical protein